MYGKSERVTSTSTANGLWLHVVHPWATVSLVMFSCHLCFLSGACMDLKKA